MSVRVVTNSVTFTWGDSSSERLQAGQLIDVPPGSALETAIGTGNLSAPTAGQLLKAQSGSGGQVSN